MVEFDLNISQLAVNTGYYKQHISKMLQTEGSNPTLRTKLAMWFLSKTIKENDIYTHIEALRNGGSE